MQDNDSELGRAAEFMERNWPAMVRIAQIELEDKNCAAPIAHAEDVAGSVRITLWEMWHKLRSPAGAMYVFTARRARTHARKCRREFPAEADEKSIPFFTTPGLNPEQIAEQAELIEWVMSLLTKDEKCVITKRYYDDLAFHSIAELSGKKIGTVTSTYSRALEKIRDAVAAQEAVSNARLKERKLESLKRRPS